MDPRQVVLVTGASTGFGRLMAQTFARHGYTVFATMRDPAVRNSANARELRELAAAESLALHVLEMDVTHEDSVDRTVRACVTGAGRIDVAINNAGYGVAGLAEATSLEQVRYLMDTNFLGSVRVNRAVLPQMRKQRSGLLLHVSSGAGRVVIPGFGFYCASKFALEAMAESYHYELAQQGIDSCIVEPGAYKTAVFGNIVSAVDTTRTETYGAANRIAEKVSGRLSATNADAQEVADAILAIVQTAPGERKLRYRISQQDWGVDAINEVCARVQERAIAAFELTEETTFVRTAATAN